MGHGIKICNECGTVLGPATASSGGRPAPLTQGDLAFEAAAATARAEVAEAIISAELGDDIPQKSDLLTALRQVEIRFRTTKEGSPERTAMDDDIMCKLREIGRRLKVA